uniref:Putative secreted protein n=1 Tax=Ixodes ricinus TaxID=34613 RepID=A0A6B0UHY4_IXORI
MSSAAFWFSGLMSCTTVGTTWATVVVTLVTLGTESGGMAGWAGSTRVEHSMVLPHVRGPSASRGEKWPSTGCCRKGAPESVLGGSTSIGRCEATPICCWIVLASE